MFEDQDPTVIVKSIKDLRRFLSNKSGDSSRSHSDIGGSPILKLSFNDASATGVDNSFFCDLDSSTSGSSFVRKHQQNIAGLDIAKKIREKDAEILQYKAKVTVLEAKYDNLKSLYKKERVEYDAEIEAYQAKQLHDKEQLTTLEEQMKQLTDKEKKAQELTMRNRDSSEYHRTQREKKMIERFNAQVEKIKDLEQQLVTLKEHNAELEEKNMEQEATITIGNSEMEIMEKRMSTLKDQLAEFQNTKLELEMLRTKLNKSNSQSKELELRLESVKEQEKNMQMFEDTIMQLPVLQKELKKIKDENHTHKLTRLNINMLQEKLNYAQTTLGNLEIRCKDLTAENATLSALRELTENYETIIKKEFNVEYLPPESEFQEMIRNLKKQNNDVDQSLSELKASIESHNSTKEDQEKLVRTLKASKEKSRFESEKNAQIIKRLQRKIFLLSKERESLQNLLSSYQSETTMNPSAIEQDRINNLETQLSNYKSEVTNLEEELSKAQQLPKYETKSKSDAVKRSNKLASEKDPKESDELIEQLREENEDLKAQLEYYSNKGVVNPLETKVIHFLDNPLDKAFNERKAEYDRLLEENETLKKRIELLEQGETSDLTEKVGRKVVTNETNSKHVKELEEKVTTMETRNKRLIDAFKERSHQMREVTYRLTGYKVDIPQDNHYKLSNVYNEGQEDFLMFQQTASGELMLLETEFSRTLDDLMDSYLQRDQSYPAFLSAITLNLFNRHTMLQSSSDQEDFEGGEEEDEEMMGDEEEELVGEEEEEENEDENEEDYEDNRAGPSAKRPRMEMEDDDDEDEEDDDEDELICLD